MNKLLAVIEQLYRRSIYRVVLFVLGLPTFLVALCSYVVYAHRRSGQVQQYRKKATAQLEAEGELARVDAEAKGFLDRKNQHFGRKSSGQDYQKQLDKYCQQERSKVVKARVRKLMQADGIAEKPTFIQFLCGKLRKNPVLAVLSVITSFPIYILAFVCRSAYIRYGIERLIMMIFVIFGVVFVVFTILYLTPYDPAYNILGDTATEEQILAWKELYGLDKSYFVQLFTWFKRLITFDLGNSYTGNEAVFTALMRKFPTTLKLSMYAMALGVLISVPLGILSAMKRGSGWDYAIIFIAIVLMSVPAFWLGMIMILNFSIKAGWLPATYSAENLRSYIMPVFVMCTGLIANETRMARSSVLEVINQDYVVTAKAKGLKNSRVILRHVLSNALIPIVTAVGLRMGGILGGSAITERVFSIQGIGNYLVSKQFLPDIPVVLSGVIYLAIVISIVNLLVDLLYAAIDPRIRADLKKQ